MQRVSVIIPCKNEGKNIRDCVMSAAGIGGEVIVADNGSTDETLEIVSEFDRCRVIEREFIGYSDFKNWAMQHATTDWVLLLDADERCTPELVNEISGLLEGEPACDAYRIPRANYFLGRRIRHCGWGGDKVVRLLRKAVCRFDERLVHEGVVVDTGAIGQIKNEILHHTAMDLDSFIAKQLKYGSLGGTDRFKRGKRASYLRTLFHAPFRFLYLYFARGGILEGRRGLVICMLIAFYSFVKDAKLWELSEIARYELPAPDPAVHSTQFSNSQGRVDQTDSSSRRLATRKGAA